MSNSLNNIKNFTFENASHCFSLLPLCEEIKDEYDTLWAYIKEINPANVHSSTLSEHRKAVLEKKITHLFNTIEMKLHPIHLKPSEIIGKQLEAIGDLSKKLETLSFQELNKTLKKMDSDFQQKIYSAIWLACGPSKSAYFDKQRLKADPSILQRRFGEQKFKADPSILQRGFHPFFAPIEGTLLEQMTSDLTMEYQLSVCKEDIDILQNKIGQDLVEAVSIEELVDKQKSLLARLMQQKDDRKIAVFQACLKEVKINSCQMKAIFEAMPQTIKPHLPSPPYFGRGFDPKLYKTLGAHYDKIDGKTTFRVYAPNARDIVLNLTVFEQIEHSLCMVKKESGIWEVQTEYAQPGCSYHFMVVGRDGGAAFKKIDPFAFGNVIHSREPGRDNHESIVCDIEKEFTWSDQAWIAGRVNINPAKTAMAIYEIHPPTWKKQITGDPLNWRDLSVELVDYCKDMGYSHVELMALLEHPQPISMGYQVTSFFALNSEMGSIEDFKYFVNYLHEQGIGVIADWMPAHFAIDAFALVSFDGTPLFEDDDPRFAGHPHWGTYEFDFKKQYTRDFLISNLDFLLSEFHLDGIRVDAVQSMLELNFGRPAGTRLNVHGDDVNLDAKKFLRNMNSYVHAQYPGVLMIAEEAMGFPNLTRPPTEKGIYTKKRGVGFDATWHMGFMQEMLNYFQTSPDWRKQAYSVFCKTVEQVDYNEDSRQRGKVVLPFSHDENSKGNKTVFIKMGGNSDPDKFANNRLFLAYQVLRGGGPILDFMGNEISQTEEWHGRLIEGLTSAIERKKAAVQWEVLDPSFKNYQYHLGTRQSRRALLHLCHNSPGLQDQTNEGISWIHAEDADNGLLSFHRRGSGQQFACVFNSSGKDLKEYMIPLPNASYAPELDKLIWVKEVYNTDDTIFGGDGRKNAYVHIARDHSTKRPTHLKLRLPPFSALLLEEHFA